MKYGLVLFFTITTYFSFAQTECKDLENLKITMDSVDNVLQQHKGDVHFLKDSIVPFFETLKLWNTSPKVVLVSTSLLFEFNEALQPNLEAVSLNCLEVFAEKNGYKIKKAKPDDSGFRTTSVYKKRSDEKSLLFVSKGPVYNEKTKTLEQNKLYLVYKWKYYTN